MADNLEFGTDAARHLDALYASGDILRRRRLVRRALGPAPGERILDVGCGPGYYVDEIARQVGPGGAVIGVDTSSTMLELASTRTAHHTNVTLLEGDAEAIPVEDQWADRALAVQVLEYVDDLEGALAELRRVMRPAGRLVVWDIDWTTLSWHSQDPDRMRRVLASWDGHLADPALPRTLVSSLRASGFEDVTTEGYAFVNTDAGPSAYSGMVMPMIADYVASSGGVSDAEAAAWSEEQQRLSAAGDYHCAVIQFCFTATRA